MNTMKAKISRREFVKSASAALVLPSVITSKALGAADGTPPASGRITLGGIGLGARGFRTWYDYSGGMMTDWGGHKFGGAMHGMGVDHTGPTEIKYPDGKNHKYLTYIFKNGVKLIKSNRQGYLCKKGWAQPWNGMPLPPPNLRWYEDGARSPHEDCVNCIVDRRRPFRDVEFAHRVATVCHLGNICFKLKRDLKWDPENEVFIDDEEANRLIGRPRRGPWQM